MDDAVTETDMPHSHRRTGDPDDGRHAIADKVDSTFSKALARWVWPTLMAVLGFLIVDKLREIQSAQDEARSRAEAMAAAMAQTDTRVALLSGKLDDRVIRQVDDNKNRIDDHEKRLQVLERAVRTP